MTAPDGPRRRSTGTHPTFTGTAIALGAGIGMTIGVLVGGGPGIAFGLLLGAGVGVAVGAAWNARSGDLVAAREEGSPPLTGDEVVDRSRTLTTPSTRAELVWESEGGTLGTGGNNPGDR